MLRGVKRLEFGLKVGVDEFDLVAACDAVVCWFPSGVLSLCVFEDLLKKSFDTAGGLKLLPILKCVFGVC